MAPGRKTGGKNFQPGQSGNPAGRPAPATAELREAKKRLRDQFEQIVIDLASKNFLELQSMVNDPATPALQLMVASVIVKAVAGGDPGRMTFLLDRLVGPVPKAVELSGAGGEPLSPIANLSSTELVTTLIEVQRLIKAKEAKCTTRSLPGAPQSSVSPAASSPRGSRSGS